MEFNAEAQRRAGVRVLRPWLQSARMVSLFYRIGLLAASRPGAVATIEMFVERMTVGRPIGSALPNPNAVERRGTSHDPYRRHQR